MSHRTTVHCDGRHCYASTSLDRTDGWELNKYTREGCTVDLCPRCKTGRCSGEIGPTYGQWSCHCLLVVNHGGPCKCSHTVKDGDPIWEEQSDG